MIAAELVVVDAVDDGQIGVFARRRDEHSLGAGGKVGRSLFLGGEQTGAFKGDIDAQFLPGKRGGVANGGDLNGAVADHNAVARHLHLMREAAVNGIEAEQMGIGFHRTQIVDRHHFHILAPGFDHGAQDIAPDTAETIDCHAYCHKNLRRNRRYRPSAKCMGSYKRSKRGGKCRSSENKSFIGGNSGLNVTFAAFIGTVHDNAGQNYTGCDDADYDGGKGIDVGGHAELHLRPDDERQGVGAGPGGEGGDDHIVERQGEGEKPAGNHGG